MCEGWNTFCSAIANCGGGCCCWRCFSARYSSYDCKGHREVLHRLSECIKSPNHPTNWTGATLIESSQRPGQAAMGDDRARAPQSVHTYPGPERDMIRPSDPASGPPSWRGCTVVHLHWEHHTPRHLGLRGRHEAGGVAVRLVPTLLHIITVSH